MSSAFKLPIEYWSSIQITPQDIENLHNFLFDREIPLTTQDLCVEFVESRIIMERNAEESKKKS
jgi:hypothetical protein